MTPMTEDAIRTMHARYAAKGEGYAPSLAETLDAAHAEHLFAVDTQNDGDDCLVIAESAEDALSEVAAHHDLDAWSAHPDGGAAYARSLRWTAERVTLARDSA